MTAAALSVPRWTWAKPEGANSDIRIAVVGFRGRGASHISGFRALPGVRIVALKSTAIARAKALKPAAAAGRPSMTAWLRSPVSAIAALGMK